MRFAQFAHGTCTSAVLCVQRVCRNNRFGLTTVVHVLKPRAFRIPATMLHPRSASFASLHQAAESGVTVGAMNGS